MKNNQTSLPSKTFETGFSQSSSTRPSAKPGYINAENQVFSSVPVEQTFDRSKQGGLNLLRETRDFPGTSVGFASPWAGHSNSSLNQSSSLKETETRLGKKLRERFRTDKFNPPAQEPKDNFTPASFMQEVGWGFGDETLRFANPNTDFSSDYSLSTAHSSRIVGPELINLEYNPHTLLSDLSSIRKPAMEEKKPVSEVVVEDSMNAINDSQMNCVSLLNEVGSKVKKKIDYNIKEVPNSKIKVFECQCLINGKKIGFGKGNSKQAAKNDSAIDAVRTLLTLRDEYSFEEAHITLSIQKTTGLGMGVTPAIPGSESVSVQNTPKATMKVEEGSGKALITQAKPEIIAADQSSLSDSQKASTVNDSALYELNLISKECFVEPRWQMSPPGGPSGDFEAEVVFDKLVAVGKGRKKLDAKREAAAKILQLIRENPELNEKYNPKINKKKLSRENSLSQLARNDARRILFENTIDPKSLKEIKSGSDLWMESITKSNKRLNEYLTQVKAQSGLSEETCEFLLQIFKLIVEYSELITSNPKQIMLDATNHLADYVSNFSLIPIGSFALDCMRREKLSVDILASFKQIKKISEKEFLQLFLDSLKECYKLTPERSQGSSYNMEFSIKNSDFRDFVEIKIKDKLIGEVVFQIQMANASGESQLKVDCDASVVHIKRIYDCFDNAESLDQFRTLMSIMRNWREKNKLFFLAPEIVDAVLLTEFLSNKAGNFAGYVTNTLITMSTEETFQASLNKCGPYYTKLYKNILSKMKWSISTKCSQSLEAIYEETFDQSNLA